MKFGAKILDSFNIGQFTHIIATISKLCVKAANDKSCVIKLTSENMYFILPEFSTAAGNAGTGRTSFFISVDPKTMFEFYICEGKSQDDNLILLEVQPESLLRALKSSPNIKMARIKLTKRQSPCLTVELDLHSISSKSNSRTITHDIPIRVISTAKISADDFQEPNVNKTTLSIQLPPLKLMKHMIERMKCLSDFVYLEATNRGDLTFKIEADTVSVCTYFRNLINLPIERSQQNANATLNKNADKGDADLNSCSVRLSLKRLSEFINALQFQPNNIICNFVNKKYAHFFVVNEDVVLQYLISAVLI